LGDVSPTCTVWEMSTVRLSFGSSMTFWTPCTVTVCAVFQLVGVKIRSSVVVYAVAESGPSTLATEPSPAVTRIVTLDSGLESSTTV